MTEVQEKKSLECVSLLKAKTYHTLLILILFAFSLEKHSLVCVFIHHGGKRQIGHAESFNKFAVF